MTSTIAESEVFRSDTRGRVRVPVERREALLDEFERSGLSGLQFARLVGINYGTFAGWWQRRRAMRKQARESAATVESGGGKDTVQLFEAVVDSEPVPQPTASVNVGALVIELPGSARMQVDSPGQLRLAAELLGMLAQTCRRVC